jgi:hypothetical protein
VKDPKARDLAGRAYLGEHYEWYCETRCAQWFIDKARNAAALCVYRSAPMDGSGV